MQKTNITFSQSDHPPTVPRPGHAPLVLDAQIGGYDMDEIFMDGGSSMNIIFVSTLRKMLIPRSVWKMGNLCLVPSRHARSVRERGRKQQFFITYASRTQDLCYGDASNG